MCISVPLLMGCVEVMRVAQSEPNKTCGLGVSLVYYCQVYVDEGVNTICTSHTITVFLLWLITCCLSGNDL